MNMPKAIFIDMDGTLFSHITKQIPKSALDALRYAKEKGVLLFIATGRNKIELKEITLPYDMSFDGFVVMNGAYCFVDGDIIFKNPLHPEAVAAVIERLEQNSFPCIFCEENHQYINIVNKLVEELQKSVNLPLPPACDPRQALNTEIFQIVAFGNEEEEAFLRSLQHSKVTQWMEGGYDLVNSTVNKWQGILHMLRHFSIAPHETAAIGDGENDIEMLINAGCSVAMGNAADSVKRHAKFVTSHVDENGLAEAIDYLIS